MTGNIDLRIDELILRGAPAWQRHDIAAAVAAELQRLVDAGGLPPWLAQGGAVPRVDVSGLRLTPGAPAAAIGQQIAGSIYQSLAGGAPPAGGPERSAT